jgi:hypothetical protein
MRTTVDIPDLIYRELKSRAAAEGGTVKELLVRGAETVLSTQVRKTGRRLSHPPLNKGVSGSLRMTNALIADLLDR